MTFAGHWQMLGFGYWAVEEKSSGKYIGDLGFGDFKRDVTPSIDGVPELGWGIASHCHGNGYATEGVRAAIAWGDKHFKSKSMERMVCMVDPDNKPSIRVAAKLDFKEFARTTYLETPSILFERRF